MLVTIVAYIINLVGLNQAGKDEPFFKTAFTISVITILASVASSVLTAMGFESAQSIAELVGELLQIMIIVYVIYGVMSLAGKLKDKKLEQRGKRLLMLIVVLLFSSILIRLMGDMASEKAGAVVVGAIGIVSAIIIFVSFVMYLMLLGRAVKILERK